MFRRFDSAQIGLAHGGSWVKDRKRIISNIILRRQAVNEMYVLWFADQVRINVDHRMGENTSMPVNCRTMATLGGEDSRV